MKQTHLPSDKKYVEKKKVFDINYSIADYESAIFEVSHYIEKKKSAAVFFSPVHSVVEARKSTGFKGVLNSATLNLPDGQPIRWALNYFHNLSLNDRVYGPEFVIKLCGALTRKKSVRVFLYGGRTDQVLSSFKKKLICEYPHILVCGSYREDDISNHTISIDYVLSTKPDLMLVGLGCPIQEKWISENYKNFDFPCLGVGAAFSLLSGDMPMAPKWMQDKGLEWFFRLYTEPGRLWKRYLIYNSVFLALAVREVCQKWYGKLISGQ